ncbi:MAG: fibronectin type III domain-containing protein [Bacteroidota bacterium]
MRKITLLCMLTLFCTFAYSQVLNQPANWPNTNWSVTGTYNTDPAAFEADPTLTANFAFDEDDAGFGSNNDIAAESPVIDLTGAFTGGELWIIVDLAYNYNDNGGDILNLEYWDADAGAWVVWQQFLASTNQPFDNFCTPAKDAFTSDPLDITTFTPTQQSGFRYRLAYDDVDGFQWGFCFDSPTITSAMIPTCFDVSNIAVANVTETTADISWTTVNGETAWEIVIQPSGTGAPTGAGTAITTNPYTATGLSGSITYEVYIRADCGATDGFSNWVGPITFTTDNSATIPAPAGVTCATGTSTFIYTEDFETDPLVGWTGNSFDGFDGNWDITLGDANSGGTGPSASFSGGSHLEYEASGNASAIASAISPVIDLTTATDGAELSFYMHAFGADIGVLSVGVGTSPTGPFTNVYAWTGQLQTAETDAWVPVGIDISAYLGQSIYIEFSYGATGNGFEGDMSIDFVRVEACGDFCIAPSSVTVSNVTGSSADIGWTAVNGETAWEIVVQPAGTGEPTGAGTAITTNPYTASGLTPNTAYEVYVRADCGGGAFSLWSGPINFNTLLPDPVGVTCATGNSSFVFTEDFETDPLVGWTGNSFDGNDGNWDITLGAANSGGTGPSASFSGGSHLEYEASGNSSTIASAITPEIDLSLATDGAELSFYLHAFGEDIGTLNVGVGTTATGPFTNVFTYSGELQTAETDAWAPVGVDLSAYLGQSIYIEFSYGATGNGFEGDMSIDLVRVEACGNFCIAPSALAASNITGDSADISWTANTGETAWEIVVQAPGTGEPTGAGTPITTNPYTATGLTPNTPYEVYIRANCGGGDFSVWAGPFNFNTLLPVPMGVTCATGTSTFIFTEDFETDPLLGWTGNSYDGNDGNWDITLGAGNSGGTGPSASFSGGSHLEYEASGNSSTIASAISPIIDLTTAVDGAELSFYLHAFGEDIGTLNVGVGTTATGPFTNVFTYSGELQTAATDAWVPVGVDLTAYLGQAIYLEFSYGATGNGFEGDMSIDLVRVEACGDFCIAPTAITVSNITDDSVDLSWTANSGETEWEYVIQPAGTGTPTGPGTTTTTNPVTVSNLDDDTDYEVYIRAVCAPGFESLWGGPVNFTTFVEVDCAAGPVSTTYCYDNNATTVFTFFASDPSLTLGVIFNSGEVENNFDELIVLDSDGVTELYNGYGNGGDISGFAFESTGSSITITVQSDGSVSCQSSGSLPIEFDVICVDPAGPPPCVSLISPSDGDTAVEINQNITWGTAFNNPAGYIVTVGTTPGGNDIVDGLDVGLVTTLPLTTNYDTTYYVTILPYNGNGLTTGCTEQVFTTRPDPNQIFNLVCADGPITITHCYTDFDDNTFTYTSDSGFPIRLTFNSGLIDDDDDVITFYDGSDNTFPVILSTNNAGDLSGLVVESSGGNLFMEVISDGFNSCADGNGTLWEWTAECLTCFKPTASYTVVDDCGQGDQFLIDVEILATGDAASITISDDFGSAPQVATATGVYTFGPYPNTTNIVITVADTDDTNCVLTSDPLTQDFCPDQSCGIINAGFDQVQTCDMTSTDLSATFMESSITSNTTVYQISDLQCPPENLTGDATGIDSDDTWSGVIDLGFDFQFFGETYSQVVVGGNGLLSFDTSLANLGCDWAFNEDLPDPALVETGFFDPDPLHRAAIFGVYHDIDPNVGGQIEFSVLGTAPERQFKVTFFQMPHFSFACNDLLSTHQIILYESSNVIDVLVLNKPTCTTWNGGNAVIGIQNEAGDTGYAPTGRNTSDSPWDVTQQELWRFVPAGNPNYTFEWLDPDGNVLSNDTDITVSPTETTTYTASITYALADGSLVTLTDDVTVTVQQDPDAGATETLLSCDDDFDGIAEFDLTLQDANIIDGQPDLSVTYYETLADAEAGTNMLADPTAFVSADGPVYFRVQDDITGCFSTGTFDVSVILQIDPEEIGLEGECINGEYTITVSPINGSFDPATVTYEWSGGSSFENDGEQFIATDDGEYTVTVTTADGCSSSQTFTVMNSMCSFPQGISPNGDNLNETWDLRAFRVQELEIFNSLGRSVYKQNNYTNQWRGQTNDNDELPVGTYFYVLRLESGESKNGWVYINK